jgi:hypothetical protein
MLSGFEKIISKFVVENNQVIQDLKAILTEQKLFYEKLYKISNPRHEELHNELFLNNDNPFSLFLLLEGM